MKPKGHDAFQCARKRGRFSAPDPVEVCCGSPVHVTGDIREFVCGRQKRHVTTSRSFRKDLLLVTVGFFKHDYTAFHFWKRILLRHMTKISQSTSSDEYVFSRRHYRDRALFMYGNQISFLSCLEHARPKVCSVVRTVQIGTHMRHRIVLCVSVPTHRPQHVQQGQGSMSAEATCRATERAQTEAVQQVAPNCRHPCQYRPPQAGQPPGGWQRAW